MTPLQTAESYNKLAPQWNAEGFDRTNGIAQHRRALQFLARKRNAIDIGCGCSGRILDLLIAEGFAAEGLDISPEMIRLARLRHPEISFHLADICAWQFSHSYDLISAWDSIWHAPLAQHELVLKKLCDALNPDGVLIFTTGGLHEPNEVTNTFTGEPLYHAALGIPRLLEIISAQGCICRHLEYDQHPELHIYLIVQKIACPPSTIPKSHLQH